MKENSTFRVAFPHSVINDSVETTNFLNGLRISVHEPDESIFEIVSNYVRDSNWGSPIYSLPFITTCPFVGSNTSF